MRLAPAALALVAACARQEAPAPPAPTAELVDVGPRLVSNATDHVISLWGRGFVDGMTLHAAGRKIPVVTIDDTHANAVFAAGYDLVAGLHEARVPLQLGLPGGNAARGTAELTIVNDEDFPRPTSMAVSPDGRAIVIAVAETDELWVFRRDSGAVDRIKVGDGPAAVAMDGMNAVVVHDAAAELRVVPLDGKPQTVIPVDAQAVDLVVDDATHTAWVTNHRLHVVEVVDLRAGRVIAKHAVGFSPARIAFTGGRRGVIVANWGPEDLSVVDGAAERRITPRPGMPIIGGRTKDLSAFIMGGKRVRGLAYSEKRKVVFASGIGPNIGPNPRREEVSMNGGVMVVDPARGEVLRHVSMGGGCGDGLALDDEKGVLFVASVSTGQVVAMGVEAMLSDDTAAKAVLGRVPILPPAGTPFLRDVADFAQRGRAGIEVHSGPRALALTDQGKTLLVLNRLTRTVTEVDVTQVKRGQMRITRTHAPPVSIHQENRWRGEIAYYTDLSNNGMSCDTCHPDGTTGGVLFTKGNPMQIYRSSPLRGIRESAPYFTPQRTPSLLLTSTFVLARNRFDNPVPDHEEVRALTIYTTLLATPPNPWLARDGTLPGRIALPDGKTGNPRAGMRVFDGKGGCSTRECHPGPHFTGDQGKDTRGRFHDVGTPQVLPLRVEMQDKREAHWPPPSLVGAWDHFPLFASGNAGLVVGKDGVLTPTGTFPLRDVVEHAGAAKHGKMGTLTAEEKDDLLAYLLTL